jgi:hypothetical protein
MPRTVKITAGNVSVKAELNETTTARKIYDALPMSSKVNTWGDEIYFSIELNLSPENQKAVVELGDIGYWPPGTALCLFFGPTPASRGEEIRPASPVNVIGKILDDPKLLKAAADGDPVRVEKA